MGNKAEEAKLETFIEWLEANKVELRGCHIQYSNHTKRFGLFSNNDSPNGVLLVVPLDLIITPMRVLQDPLLGPVCRAMFEEGEVDDRFLMNLFLIVERLRKNSSWKPYLDMLPTSFGNPLWFTDDELLELKGTTLYRATELQKRTLQSVYDDKVEKLVTEILNLDGSKEREARFEDFLWANSIFWTRAMNIPLPHSYVFPEVQEENENSYSKCDASGSANCNSREVVNGYGKESEVHITSGCEIKEVDSQLLAGMTASKQTETVWVEGLVPGIDFCNHDLNAAATWEVDGTGKITGVPFSMYLLSAEQIPYKTEKEISISYGNKGNEELLYLYGFVIDNNPDDYLMVHYPVGAIQSVPFSDSKLQLLEAQKAELRCLLPRNLLEQGFIPQDMSNTGSEERAKTAQLCNYSWSGQRPKPAYFDKLVFPDNFLTALRTIAMTEDELFRVTSLLEELVGSEGQRQPSDLEVRAAVWEVSGDSGALQLLVDLLQTKMMDLEENSGTEDCDAELLRQAYVTDRPEQQNISDETSSKENGPTQQKLMSRNKWSAIVYRRGQKQLTRLFLQEAEHVLRLSLGEES